MAEKKAKPAAKKTPTTKKAPATKKAIATKKPATKKSKLVEIKTKPTKDSVADFIYNIPDDQKQKDSFTLIDMMKKASGEEPVLWGSIIGFGNKRYVSPATGREVDWLKIGFSPRKANLSLYLTMDINAHADTLDKLGKYKTGKGCLYINKLDDVDIKVLNGLIKTSLKGK